ncbi:unnamed protein product, partial [Ectocarpus sp. 8 AP-2014]
SHPKEGEAEAATAAGKVKVKVRFTGTSKGASDELIQVKDVLRVTEKTMQLKKEYEARKGKGSKPSGMGRGRPPKKKPAPTEPSTAAAAAAPPPTAAKAAAAAATALSATVVTGALAGENSSSLMPRATI